MKLSSWKRKIAKQNEPLGLSGGNQKMKLSLRPNTRIHALKGLLGNFAIAPSNGFLETTNLLSLDANLAISTRVLHFEVFGLRHRTPAKPVLLTSQTGTH
jgi:hypothetical protein